MRLLSVVAAGTTAPPFHSPLDSALVVTGGGLIFSVIGFLMWPDYRGARRRLLGAADDPPPAGEALRRFNVRFLFGGDEERFAHHRTQTMPFFLGVAFMVMGGVVLLIGLMGLAVSLIHAL